MTHFLHRTNALLGEEALHELGKPLVSIAGLGGVGGPAFMTLVRTGVKRFRLAERGIFDPPDMNRQWAALGSTMDRPKLDVYVEWAKGINPEVEIEEYPDGITLDNLESFLPGSDVHIGAIDIDAGKDLTDAAEEILLRERIPIFTSVACAFGTIMVNYEPGGMTPPQFWSKAAAQSKEDSPFLFLARDTFSPALLNNTVESFKTNQLATCAIGASTAGMMLASEIIAFILKDSEYVDRDILFAPSYVVADLLSMQMKIVTLPE